MINPVESFVYAENIDSEMNSEAFVLEVPAGIVSKKRLMTAIARAGHFPEYFGANWDALLDCLRDMDWIKKKKVLIIHHDLPLADDAVACGTYLGVLQDALAGWQQNATSMLPDKNQMFVDRTLRIVFPVEKKFMIEKLYSDAAGKGS